MGDNGILRICVSVTDLRQSTDFYTTQMELQQVGTGSLSARETKALYGMDGPAAYTLLKNPYQATILQLLEFTPRPTRRIREGQPSWNYGYYDIAFRCKDDRGMWKAFTSQGYSYPCPPYEYVADWSNVAVLEAVMSGPDDVPLGMIERVTAPVPVFDGTFRNFTDVVLTVESMGEADRFYVEVLGLEKVFDKVMPDGLVDPVVGVPLGVHTRIAMYAGGQTPIVEILEFSRKGTSMEAVAVPQNAGLFATCFETADLDALIARAAEKGFPVKYGPVSLRLAHCGDIRSAILKGPGGAMFEVFQSAK